MTDSPRIGMDIGGTKVEAVALGPDGEVEARAVVPTVPGPEGVLGVTSELISRLAAETGRTVADFAGVGIGIPGQVDRTSGVVRNAYNMGLTSLALGPELAKRSGIRVYVDNDVRAASLGAAHIMRVDGTVTYLNLGTGLAAGIIIGGSPVRGAHGFAGEIGHIPVDPRRRACPCGQFGCLETVASGSALKTYWPGAGEHPGRTLLSAIAAGDSDAKLAFDYLVEGAANTVRLLGLSLNPDAIIIGGGLRLIGTPLFDGIRATLEAWAAESSFLAALELSERLQVLPADSPAAAIGAAIAVTE